jgi:integrase
MSTFFVWAMTRGICDANPVIGTAVPEVGKSRERVLSDDELAAVWRACKDDDHGRVVRLLILTGCRRQEVGGMAWSEIDLERGLWKLPAARSKNKRAHELPLMPMALDVINAVPRVLTRDHLFGARSGNGFRKILIVRFQFAEICATFP